MFCLFVVAHRPRSVAHLTLLTTAEWIWTHTMRSLVVLYRYLFSNFRFSVQMIGCMVCSCSDFTPLIMSIVTVFTSFTTPRICSFISVNISVKGERPMSPLISLVCGRSCRDRDCENGHLCSTGLLWSPPASNCCFDVYDVFPANSLFWPSLWSAVEVLIPNHFVKF